MFYSYQKISDITLEDVTCEDIYQSAIRNKSSGEKNAICFRLIGEVFLKNETNKPNISTPHLLAGVLYQAYPRAVKDLREYVFPYMDCDAYDGECLASGCDQPVLCWRKCKECEKKTYLMKHDDYEYY